MKHASNPRRGRGRNNGKRNQNPRSKNFESSGSEQKVRGTAQQVLDKYLALARDATSAGDRIAAEGYFQHAEHYYRILYSEEGAQDGNKKNDRDRNAQGRQNPEQSQENQNRPPRDNTQSAETTPETSGDVKAQGTSEPEAEKIDAQATTPEVSQETVEEKPRRRGRPRKSEAAKEAPKDGEPSETAA